MRSVLAHLESSAELTDIDGLLSVGAWGPLHELGHNHQNVDWVLPGTTESMATISSRGSINPAMTSSARNRLTARLSPRESIP